MRECTTCPDEPVEVHVAASQSNAARLAGQIGDGMISTSPDEELVKAFEDAGGNGKPKLGMIHVAYDKDAEKGLERGYELWRTRPSRGRSDKSSRHRRTSRRPRRWSNGRI
jgi:alkanesulfonate monooxygenase SsuD/methylene tetrahydromethanopterin reductase-like flavin-dependent oxidoreductase (luciferase family)